MKHDFVIGGDSLAESVRSFCSCVCDSVSPLPGTSKEGDSIAGYLCSLVDGAGSTPSPVAGASDVRFGGTSGVVISSAVPSVPASFSLFSSSTLSHPPLPPPGFSFPSVTSSLLLSSSAPRVSFPSASPVVATSSFSVASLLSSSAPLGSFAVSLAPGSSSCYSLSLLVS